MRILVITEYYRNSCFNGAEVFAKELIIALREIHTVDVLAHATDDDLPGLAIPIPAATYGSVEGLKQFLQEKIKPHQYDVIYNLGGLLFGCFIVIYMRHVVSVTPLVNHFQLLFAPLAENEQMTNAKQHLISKPQIKAASSAAVNIFVSINELQKAIQYGLPVERSSVAVIPNGMATSGNNATGSSFDILVKEGKKPVVFLMAGRFSEYSKGADIAFRAFRRLLQDRNDVYLVVVGPSEKYRFILENVSEQHCRFIDWLPREELLDLFTQADIALVPSRYEPFGMIAIEAMSKAVPVIANDTGGLSEIVHHQRTGLLNPLRNGWLGFYKCMKELASHPDERTEMALRARETVLQKFTIEQVASAVDQQLRRAVLSHKTLEPQSRLFPEEAAAGS